jgi:hypothetical protein
MMQTTCSFAVASSASGATVKQEKTATSGSSGARAKGKVTIDLTHSTPLAFKELMGSANPILTM